MCKYCKRLKELKELDDKRFYQIINSWRRRDLISCYLLRSCWELLTRSDVYSVLKKDSFSLDIDDFLKKLVDFIDCDWIGK